MNAPIKLELTDKQLEVLGTAIGKEIFRSFSAKQEHWYGSTGWLSKVLKGFAEDFANQMTVNLRVYEEYFVSAGKKILDKK